MHGFLSVLTDALICIAGVMISTLKLCLFTDVFFYVLD